MKRALYSYFRASFGIALGLWLALGLASPAAAQRKQIRKADTAFTYHSYYKALSFYQKAFSKFKKADKAEADRTLFQIAECYRLSGQYKPAAAQYKRAIRAKYYMYEPKVFFYLAQLQLTSGDFAGAYENFDAYLDFIPDDSTAIEGREAARRTEEAMQKVTRYEIENLKKLNSRDGDWTPRYYTPDGEIIAFTSTREGVTGRKLDPWSGQRFSDIWVAKRDAKGEWSTPERLDQNEKTSTNLNESDAAFCQGGGTMYYTYCTNTKKTQNRCIIRTSTFDGTAWSDPVDVNIGGDSVSDFIHPFVTEDGGTLFFASNRAGGEGDLDIWYATGSGSDFGEPVNAGPYVNSIEKEAYPFLRTDTLLYFSSTGHGSLGGYDIFKATKREGVFTDVENPGYPINTNADDFGICFLPGLNKGMFSSNRAGSLGSDDLFSFYLPDIIFTLSGTVRNDDNMQPIADAEINLAGSDGMILRTLTNSKGFYRFDNAQILPQTTYQLTVEKKDFLGGEATETTVGLVASTDLVRDFSLSKIPQGPVVLPEILYDLGRWELKPQYEDSLFGLIMLLEKNPRLVIELASHTDVRPIAMGNDSLSQLRAQSVVDYLITRGIHPQRLVAKGYGARVPRTLSTATTSTYGGEVFTFEAGTTLSPEYIDSLPEKGRREAAHQLNRRTEFSVLRDDFIPTTDAEDAVGLIGLGNVLQERSVPFQRNPNGMPEFTVIVNGTGMQAVLNEKAKLPQISTEAVMRLLQNEKLGKKQFKDGEAAFDQHGEVLPNKRVFLQEIKVGRFYIDRTEFVTVEELPADLILSKAALKKAGEYTVDNEQGEIKFE